MTETSKKMTANELRLRLNGRIDKVERFDTQNGPIYETLVVLPSTDNFSSPFRFTVRSTRQFGQQGATADVVVQMKSRYWKSNAGKVNYSPEMWLDEAA